VGVAVCGHMARTPCQRLHASSVHICNMVAVTRLPQADIESTYKERDQSFCWDVRDEYIRNFLHGELVTGNGWSQEMDGGHR